MTLFALGTAVAAAAPSFGAEHLGISRGTLARYARDGLLRPTLTLPTGHLRWSLEDLRRQMRELRG